MVYSQKKKFIALLAISAIIVLALFIYYKPLQLAKTLENSAEIRYICIEFSVSDGELYTGDSGFITLTSAQREKLTDIFSQYDYTRNFRTLFSDGSMSNLGNELLSIYTYKGDDLVNSISISSQNTVSVNEKVYKIANSAQLINEIKTIHEE